jgi:hypothetical protein
MIKNIESSPSKKSETPQVPLLDFVAANIDSFGTKHLVNQ